MWWVLTSQFRLPGYTTLAVHATTNLADHLFMAWNYYRPVRHPLYVTVRGQRTFCGYKWVWDTPFIAEQLQSGDTLDHTFSLRHLRPGSTIWWYLFAPDGPYGRQIQGPLDSVTLMTLPTPPRITPEPITFNVPNRILRCGNRYTFWAFGSWYAFVPTRTSLTMWILIADTFHRLDQANEPTPINATIEDADARMDTLGLWVHISFFDKANSPDDHLVRYVKFNLYNHSWETPETAHIEGWYPWAQYWTCLALDVIDKPHIIYSAISIGWPIFFYRNKIKARWSAHVPALWSHLRVLNSPSADIDPTRNAFHCCCVTHAWIHWYNLRPCGGPFEDTMIRLPDAWNTPHHSLSAADKEPHIASINLTWKVDHSEGLPPYHDQLDLSDPMSKYANMITSPEHRELIAIIFVDDDNHLSYLYRPPAADWESQVQLDPDNLSILTAHYAHPDVISCLWQRPGFQETTFYSFWAPWH